MRCSESLKQIRSLHCANCMQAYVNDNSCIMDFVISINVPCSNARIIVFKQIYFIQLLTYFIKLLQQETISVLLNLLNYLCCSLRVSWALLGSKNRSRKKEYNASAISCLYSYPYAAREICQGQKKRILCSKFVSIGL